MAGLIAGDVVILPFPFTDPRREKSRPDLILGTSVEGSYIMCQITTQFQSGLHSLPLKSNNFVKGGLSKPSFVRVDMIFTILPKRVKRKAGHVERAYSAQVNRYLFEFLERQRS